MKLFNKILFGATALAVSASFSSCKEEATLSGADAVYITISPTDMTMLAGDTLRLTARVENASGKVIETPISWSVDDESVVKLSEITLYKNVKNPDYVDPSEAGSPSEGEDDGEGETGGDEAAQADEGDVAGDDSGSDNGSDTGVNTESEYLKVPKETFLGIIAQDGAQGKSTVIRATLENGMYAITTVTIGRNNVNGSVKAAKEEMMSYNDIINDTCWFEVSPIGVVDDYPVSYKFDYVERLTEAEDPAESDFIPNPYDDGPIYIDRENSRVGVIFTAPRIAGKATCTLTVGDDDSNSSALTTIFLFPQLTSGLEYESGGKTVRPGAGIQTPSNIKPRMETVDLDINSEKLVGVCIGVRTQRPVDIANAMAAELGGYFKWEVTGSSVIVEEQFFDENYENSGYVSYLKVKSGTRTGLTRCVFTIPGECIDSDTEPQEFICDINVMDFNKQYPVTDILIKDTQDEEGGTVYEEGALIQAYVGTPLDLFFSTVPSASFSFHIPEITVSEPTVLQVDERGANDGYRRTFRPLKPGLATVTAKSLDVVKTIRIKVDDRVDRIVWNDGGRLPEKLVSGVATNAIVDIYMKSNTNTPANYTGNVVWTTSDSSILSVDVDQTDSRRAVVTGHADGTATLRVEVPGEYAIEQTITVETVAGQEYNDSNISDYIFGSDENGEYVEICLVLPDDTQIVFDFNYGSPEEFEGAFTGSDAVIKMYDENGDVNMIPGCTYDITITFDGNNYIANGWFETPGGTRYSLNNLTLSL